MSNFTDSYNDSKKFVAIGKITSPHGIKGNIKIYCYNDVESIQKNDCFFEDKTKIEIKVRNSKNNIAIAEIKDCIDRDTAENYRNKEIFIYIEPIKEQDIFYHNELIGMTVRSENNSEIGKITSVENFGASDLIEVTFKNGKADFFSFDKNIFLEINLDYKFVTFKPPEVI
jgi:16S rRNA processing protein RimM